MLTSLTRMPRCTSTFAPSGKHSSSRPDTTRTTGAGGTRHEISISGWPEGCHGASGTSPSFSPEQSMHSWRSFGKSLDGEFGYAWSMYSSHAPPVRRLKSNADFDHSHSLTFAVGAGDPVATLPPGNCGTGAQEP